jgi:hypothetical protein
MFQELHLLPSSCGGYPFNWIYQTGTPHHQGTGTYPAHKMIIFSSKNVRQWMKSRKLYLCSSTIVTNKIKHWQSKNTYIYKSNVYLHTHNKAGLYSPSLSWPEEIVCVCLAYATISRGGILVLCTLTTLSWLPRRLLQAYNSVIVLFG